MTKEAWLSARRGHITATDAAALLGCHPYRSALDVYLHKVHGASQPVSEQMMNGAALEGAIVRLYRDREDLPSLRRWRRWTLREGRFPLACTPDATRRAYGGKRCPVECKLTNGWGWQDGPPVYIQVQLQVQIACLNAPSGWIVALVGSELKQWEIPRHEETIALVHKAANAFWVSHVMSKRVPWPDARHDGAEKHTAALQALYPEPDKGQAVHLPDEADAWRDDLEMAKAREKDAKIEASAKGDLLRRALGPAGYGVTPGGSVVAWTGTKTRRLTLPKRLPRGVAPPEDQ